MMCASAGLATSVLRTFAFDTRFAFTRRATIALLTVAFATRLAVSAITTATLWSELCGHKRFVIATWRTDNLNALWLFPSALWSEHGDDVDAVHHEIRICTNNVADLGAFEQQRTVEFTLG
jgi:tryptophan-rich sensory protein